MVALNELPLNTFVSTLRDRFLKATGSTLGAASMQIAYNGRILTNSQSIASYNLEDEDTITLVVREKKGGKKK